jgi:hypothetical protein
MHSVKLPKGQVQSSNFGHELPQPLDLDNYSVKPSKAKPKVQERERMKEHPLHSMSKTTSPI